VPGRLLSPQVLIAETGPVAERLRVREAYPSWIRA
jgi:hypothetical protein